MSKTNHTTQLWFYQAPTEQRDVADLFVAAVAKVKRLIQANDDQLGKQCEYRVVISLEQVHEERSPYKNTTSTEALHVATGPEANVVIKCTAVKSMTAYKLLLHATEPDGVLIHNIETDHGGEKKTAHPGLAKITPFSVAKWHAELHSPIHDGPYLGKLAAGESLYFTVEFTKASKLSILVGGPLWRDQT